MASFLMGQMSSGGYESVPSAMQNYQYAWFAQDNWKATPNLR